MHLTNYAIQKRSDDFVRDEDSGTKRYEKLYGERKTLLLKIFSLVE